LIRLLPRVQHPEESPAGRARGNTVSAVHALALVPRFAMPTRIWWQHVRWPLAVFLPLAFVLATTDVDVTIARLAFFDAGRMHWIGAGNWWTEDVIHIGGRWFIRTVVAFAGAVWLATYFESSFRHLRRPAAYFVITTVLAIGCVGFLKTVTNVDCPWDLAPFGGNFPFVHLFADRNDALRLGRCFPATHASSGYALVVLYFVWRERSRILARVGLAIGLAGGIVFGIAQQSRGAHFFSHDVWSAFIVWFIAASVYAFCFAARLGEPAADPADALFRARHGSRRAPPQPAR
jgi:membrane-associated PAP2 superfamily phosphatase